MRDMMLPPTAVPWRTVVAGVIGVLLSLTVVLTWQPPLLASLGLMLAACAIPMWVIEHRRFRSSADGNDGDLPPFSRTQVRRLRMTGGLLVFVLLALTIRLQLSVSGSSVAGLHVVQFPLLVAAGIWAVLQGLLLPRDRPAPGAVGQLALSFQHLLSGGSWSTAERQCLLAWCVKLFFLPLMLAWLHDWLALLHVSASPLDGWMPAFLAAMTLLYALDTLFGTVGYLSTHRAIGAHIRSTDASWLGWLSALVCYPPLNLLVLRQWLDYQDEVDWTHWLGDSWVAGAWALAILALTAVYTLSTLVFGPRFSNLTHRGIITSGPFRLTKHPAYISKNLSWWLVAVPFISNSGPKAAALNCAALLAVNGIYWLRAKTEERHLMADPTYQQYAAWIAMHGMFARCRRTLRPKRAT